MNRRVSYNKSQAVGGLRRARGGASSFLREFFHALNRERIPYCVLRNYEGLPRVAGRDIDLLIPPDALPQFEDILDSLAAKHGRGVAREVHRYHLNKYSIALGGSKFLNVDVLTRLLWRGIECCDSKHILQSRLFRDTIAIPAKGCEAAVLMLKACLRYGKAQERYAERIKSLAREDPVNFVRALKPYFGAAETKFLLRCAQRPDWQALERRSSAIRLNLLCRAAGKTPLRQLRRWINFLKGHITDRFIYPSGLLVALIGPDGSGKSTIAEMLRRKLGDSLFNGTDYRHGRFGILPRLRSVLPASARKYPRANRSEVRILAMPRALLYLCYYTLDYMLGHFSALRAKGAGKLVIFDRYFYDYAIQRGFSRLPVSLIMILGKLIPRPDVIISLRSNAEEIYSRKGELTPDEISWQLERCRSVAAKLPNAFEVETGCNLPEVLARVERLILRHTRQRRRRRTR